MKRIAGVILICLMLTGCTARHMEQKTLFAMDTVMDLQVWAADAGEGESALEAVEELIRKMEATWSATDEKSLLAALNRGEAPASGQEQALLAALEALSVRTGGAFDPKLGAVSALWGFTAGDPSVPDPDALADARKEARWDLGGAVKGYLGQQCVRILQERKIDRAVLNLGGNIQTYGEKPDGKPWQIGIQDPEGEGNIGILSVEGTVSIVTSGDYQRYFEENGARYHHIIDPKTGYPAESGLRSVTVISRDGLTADVLSTALFVMGLEEAAEFWRESDDFEAVFLLTGGQVYTTEGVVLSGCEYEVIHREK